MAGITVSYIPLTSHAFFINYSY